MVIQTIVAILIILVAVEFAVHIVYHAITGKAGLYDAPVAYLKDVFNHTRKG